MDKDGNWETSAELREEICRRLRETFKEYGQNQVIGAIILGQYDLISPVGGHTYLIAPTIQNITLANVSYKVARFFESSV